MIAEIVAQADVDSIWPAISARIIKCLEKTPTPDFTAGDLYTMCRAGMVFLIVVHDGQKFTSASVWRFEQTKFACLMLVGEKASEWVHLLFEKASEIARQGGAHALVASGRTGLFAVLKRQLPTVRIIRHTYEIGI